MKTSIRATTKLTHSIYFATFFARRRRILKDFCMTVQGCRMFTHSAVENIVYQKYISSPENNIKLHQMMGRYFGKMAPTERQLSCLVWHLEVSGSWNKLKTVLVEIDNFKIWWTEENKTEFMNLWASLTNFAQRGREPVESLVTGQFRESRMRYNQVPRPYCDIVEEFTKSIDIYKNKIDNEFAKKSFDEIAEMKTGRKKEVSERSERALMEDEHTSIRTTTKLTHPNSPRTFSFFARRRTRSFAKLFFALRSSSSSLRCRGTRRRRTFPTLCIRRFRRTT